MSEAIQRKTVKIAKKNYVAKGFAFDLLLAARYVDRKQAATALRIARRLR